MNIQLTDAVKNVGYSAKKCFIGIIMNSMLSSTETAHLPYDVLSPFDKDEVIASIPAVFNDDEPNNKEKELINLCLKEKEKGRKVLVYSNLTGVRDLVSRLSILLENVGLKTAVLRSTVATTKREDWILDKVDLGIDVMICNPKLVETGLDLLDFPTIVFMQTGYNVYTTMQATRRSWRIGQTQDVNIHYICYRDTAQQVCLSLMSEKIKVTQGASGKMPETGLEALNNNVDDIQTAIAKQILSDEPIQVNQSLFNEDVI
jgi:SNF2 family DNA or RNA helicase